MWPSNWLDTHNSLTSSETDRPTILVGRCEVTGLRRFSFAWKRTLCKEMNWRSEIMLGADWRHFSNVKWIEERVICYRTQWVDNVLYIFKSNTGKKFHQILRRRIPPRNVSVHLPVAPGYEPSMLSWTTGPLTWKNFDCTVHSSSLTSPTGHNWSTVVEDISPLVRALNQS